jgi:5-methylcytosine-specific restriction protein A
MPAFLLTWNPDKWKWTELPEQVKALERGEEVPFRWSTGSTKRISPGDRLFLLRQVRHPRGIIASGVAVSEVRQVEHWDPERAEIGRPANVIDLRFDVLIDPERNPDSVLKLEDMHADELAEMNWHPQASGTIIPPRAARQLEQLLWQYHGRLVGEYRPEEIIVASKFAEGSVRTVFVDRRERNPLARRACLDHWGTKCVVCDFDFGQVYGELGTGYIEVHHLTPLAEARENHEVDPIRELRPVCPNCHAMLHRNDPILTPEQLQNVIRGQRESR